jgi:hypothetical protein
MKMKAYVHAQYSEWAKEYRFSIWSQDMSSCGGYVLVQEVEVDFEAPPREVLVNGTIEAYRKEQQNIRAEAESKVNRIQQAIDDLLCLEYKPEASAE